MQLKRIIISLIGSVLLAGNVLASTSNSGGFLLDKVSARSAALSAGVGDIGGVDILSWNPGGIYRAEEIMLELTHYTGVNNKNNIEQLCVLYPGILGGTIGGKVYYEWLEKFKKIESGEEKEEVEYKNLYIDLAYSYNLYDILGLGVGVKLIDSKLLKYESKGLAVDIGISSQLWEFLSVGLVVENIGEMQEYAEEKDSLPLQLSVGVVLSQGISELHKIKVLLDASQELVEEQELHIRVGAEYELLEMLSLRVGYRIEEKEKDNLSVGGGIKYEGLGLDYAYQPHEELGEMHRISLSYGINVKKCCREKKVVKAKESVKKVKSVKQEKVEESKVSEETKAKSEESKSEESKAKPEGVKPEQSKA